MIIFWVSIAVVGSIMKTEEQKTSLVAVSYSEKVQTFRLSLTDK
jgi:hypothetical protein